MMEEETTITRDPSSDERLRSIALDIDHTGEETTITRDPSSDERLRSIALDIDHTGEDCDTTLARDIVRGMLAGTWALVHHFDEAGRHFIMVRRQEARARALTPRERQVVSDALGGSSNKLIAYRLGIAEATVATHLRRAMDKLGVSSRTELIRVLPPHIFETE